MVPSESQPFFKDERGQTDESLHTERGRTDESLVNIRKQNELETDQIVKRDRQGADSARAQIRSDADREMAGDAGMKTTDQLEEQRHDVDESVEAERSLMDAVILRERQANRELAQNLLGRERKETDANLLHERSHTDTEVLRATGELSDEQVSHSITKAALTTRDEFLAIVSHDLRNPIGAIVSASAIVLDNGTQNLTDQQKTMLELIKRNAESALRLIGDILDLERVVGGKLELDLALHDVQLIILEVKATFAHLANSNGIAIEMANRDETAFAVCDHDRIAQVLSNLLSNAIKFSPRGGSVTIWTKSITTATGNTLEVSVADSGPGVPDEQKHRIFERYAQLANPDRRGLGLGLYISKTLVEAHEGKLGVTSALGSGSTFVFTIPVRPSVNCFN